MSTERHRPSATPHELLAAAASALARPRNGDPVAAVLDVVVQALGADRAAVFARDPERDDVALVASVGPGLPEPAPATLAAAVEAIPTLARDETVDGVPATAADLPLIVSTGGVELGLGAVSFHWSGHRPSEERDAELLGAIADLLAAALDRSRLASLADARSDRSERLAMMDGLTGLANARTLDRVLDLELARAGRQGGDVSVAVFDVDGFEALNERRGRAAGDDLLREVAAALAASVRLVDTVARTGADEFVVVAPGSGGRAVARRVVEAVAALPGEGSGGVTLSAGVAHFPADGTTADELLGEARQALRSARVAGGGRIAGVDGVEA